MSNTTYSSQLTPHTLIVTSFLHFHIIFCDCLLSHWYNTGILVLLFCPEVSDLQRQWVQGLASWLSVAKCKYRAAITTMERFGTKMLIYLISGFSILHLQTDNQLAKHCNSIIIITSRYPVGISTEFCFRWQKNLQGGKGKRKRKTGGEKRKKWKGKKKRKPWREKELNRRRAHRSRSRVQCLTRHLL